MGERFGDKGILKLREGWRTGWKWGYGVWGRRWGARRFGGLTG